MAVQEQTPYVTYTGNGVTTAFAYPFKVLQAQDLAVSFDDVLQPSGLYTISGLGNDAGGTVTFFAPPGSGVAIVIASDVVNERTTDYIENGDLLANTLDDDIDRLWLAQESTRSLVGGAIRVPYPEQVQVLPKASQRLDRLLAFDPLTGKPELSEFTQTQVQSAIAAAYSGAKGPLDALSFVQEGAGAVSQSAQSKARKTVAMHDFDSGQADKAFPFQLGFNVVKSKLALAVENTQMRYGARTIVLEPGVYDFSTTLELDADAKIVANGPPGSVILRYNGAGIAAYINSTQLTLAGAPNNTRVFEMENVALLAENASEGIRIGANSNTSITFKGCEIFGVNGRPINCGEAVYFLALHQMKIRFCTQPAYIGPYCDLFTVDDRSGFFANPNGSLLLECPTFLITNSDFELGAGLAEINVRNSAGMAMNRNGMIFKNRFGPETTGGASPVQYDIAITENAGLPGGSALSDLKIWANDHFSGGAFPKKTAPILLDARVRRLDIRGDRSGPGAYLTDNVVAAGSDLSVPFGTGGVWNNFVDDRDLVQPDLRGLFSANEEIYKRLAISSSALSAYRVVYAPSLKVLSAGTALGAAHLAPSGSKTNYSKAIGITTYAMSVSDRPLVIASNGDTIATNLDTTGAAYFDSVFLGAAGALTLTDPGGATSLRVGRVLTVGANATILVDIAKVD